MKQMPSKRRKHQRRKTFRAARARTRVERRARENAKLVVGRRRKYAAQLFAAAMLLQGFEPARDEAGEAVWVRRDPARRVRRWTEEQAKLIRETLDRAAESPLGPQ